MMKSEEDLCRLCLFQYTTPQDVSLEDDTIRVKLEATFSYAFPLHASFPKRVCSECMTTANELQLFFDTVRSNQDQLSASHHGVAALQLDQTIDQDTDIFQVKIEPEPQSDDECGEFISADLFDEPHSLSSIEISDGKIEPELSESSFTEREESTLSDQTTEQQSDTSVAQSSDSRSSLELSKVDVLGSESVRCRDCFLPFPSTDLYRTHLMSAHGRVLCTQCGRSYANKNTLQVHTANVHKSRQLICETCNEEFSTKKDYLSHVERTGHSGATQKCPLCQEWFKNRTKLQAHKRKYHSTACDVCQQDFPHSKALSGHMKSAHWRQFCEICDRLFSSPAYLKVHEAAKHSDRKRHPCVCCGKSFQTKAALMSHMRNRHPFEWIEMEKQEEDVKIVFQGNIPTGPSK